MHYVDEGAKDAPPVLLFHGQPSWRYLDRKMILLLVDAGFRVLAPDIRTRLMTAYVVIMFIGGGIASTISTNAYDAAGWNGNVAIAGLLAGMATILSLFALYKFRPD